MYTTIYFKQRREPLKVYPPRPFFTYPGDQQDNLLDIDYFRSCVGAAYTIYAGCANIINTLFNF